MARITNLRVFCSSRLTDEASTSLWTVLALNCQKMTEQSTLNVFHRTRILYISHSNIYLNNVCTADLNICYFRLYPRFGTLFPEGIEMLKKSDDAEQVRNSLETFAVSSY